eukprot:TRINITY_DN31690_c0_g1_i1.p1 TRINITY_DN31690_c0_g1~~TRINITY_DN31690_c0_g1_i1.p1  ORF type:complete len:226 (+),score=48.05 TRINITY_DN31690_c0_g1_i1:226-903(+)
MLNFRPPAAPTSSAATANQSSSRLRSEGMSDAQGKGAPAEENDHLNLQKTSSNENDSGDDRFVLRGMFKYLFPGTDESGVMNATDLSYLGGHIKWQDFNWETDARSSTVYDKFVNPWNENTLDEFILRDPRFKQICSEFQFNDMSKLSEETLFSSFFINEQSASAEAAATELSKRGWMYSNKLQKWLKRKEADPSDQNSNKDNEWVVFDAQMWEYKSRKIQMRIE